MAVFVAIFPDRKEQLYGQQAERETFFYPRAGRNREFCLLIWKQCNIFAGAIRDGMNGQPITIILSDEAKAFIKLQPFKAQQKIYYNIFKVEGGVMDKELFKKLENSEIWELRTLFNGICYRLFAFWDNEIKALVMVTHGIVKKTQKTPKKEIEKAERIRQEYFNDKK